MTLEQDPPSATLRPQPKAPEETKLVDLQQYCELIVSRRVLERLYRAPRGFLGLRDASSGEVYLVHEAKLLTAS